MLRWIAKSLLAKANRSVYQPQSSFVTYKTEASDISDLLHALRPKLTHCGLIRIGPDGDGGYLIPDDLDGISHVFSPGVCQETGFERSCISSGMSVFMADRTVDNPLPQSKQIKFIKKHIEAFSSEDGLSFNRWYTQSLNGEAYSDLMLQMDIEGSEYEVILSIDEDILKSFRIIILEFHSLDQLNNRQFFAVARQVFYKLLNSHDCVHIHPNNCCGTANVGRSTLPVVAEFTFYRKGPNIDSSFASSYPHPLDCPNTPKPDIVLDNAIWHD